MVFRYSYRVDTLVSEHLRIQRRSNPYNISFTFEVEKTFLAFHLVLPTLQIVQFSKGMGKLWGP
jgi:hypothetical protein